MGRMTGCAERPEEAHGAPFALPCLHLLTPTFSDGLPKGGVVKYKPGPRVLGEDEMLVRRHWE